MAPLYKPPIKGTTVTIPWLSLVVQADPDFERRKHREVEYYSSGGKAISIADPYKRGAYNTPQKLSIVAYAGPQVFNAGDITGSGNDFVTVVSDALTPGILTTRTGAQMFSDIANAVPGIGYALRIVNFQGTSQATIAPGQGVLMYDGSWSGQLIPGDTIAPGQFTDYQVQFPDQSHALFKRVAIGQPYSTIIG